YWPSHPSARYRKNCASASPPKPRITVSAIACGNTMGTLGWTKADMLDFAKIEDVGVAALMNLQKQGYAYIAW
ncbi:MAG: hypothetical protein E6Q64_06070, partial [Ottowia sp.]